MRYNLKLELMTNGINLTNPLKEHLTNIHGKFYNDDYVTTNGIMFEIGKSSKTYVTAHFNKNSPYTLDLENESLILRKIDKTISTKVLLWFPPVYMSKDLTIDNIKMTTVVNSHFDRVRINPILGCANHCAFCDLNTLPYKICEINFIEKCLNVALQDKNITHILISGGSPKLSELPYLTQVYEYFPKHFPNYPIDVMMTPRGFDSLNDESQYLPYLEKLKSFGIDGLSVNIELFNDEIRRKYCPEKNAIGIDKYLYFLECASKVFGTKKVRSGLIVGLESLEDTLKGVRAICKAGCMPMLSPYVPYNDIGQKPTIKDLQYVLQKTKEILKEYNIPLAPLCKKCQHNTL